MIEWMSEKTCEAWDTFCPYMRGAICEVNDDALKGHIVIQLELDDDYIRQLDLGDCTGLFDAEIDRRFREKFGEFVEEYENSEECCGPVLENLENMNDALKSEGNEFAPVDEDEVLDFMAEELRECEWVKEVRFDNQDARFYLTTKSGREFTVTVCMKS